MATPSLFASPEQFAAANKSAIDALLALANTALASAERVSSLNLNIARSLVEDSVANTRALFAAKDVQEVLALQTSLAQPSVEKLVSYSRSLNEIAVQSQQEISKLLEAQYRDFQKSVSGLLEHAAKSAPAGSDVAVAAVKSAFAAANSAFDSLNTAAKQVAEISEANVAAATDATVKAVSATTAARKRTA
jgi:phasin family protein